MDYYSFDSEVIEFLNILRPPVKRGPTNKNKDFSVYCNNTKNNFQVLREFGHKLTSKRTDSHKQTSYEDSSTSLILKKTSESQILKQYSVLSYTSLHCQEQSTLRQTKPVKEKPLIKVTVIPKSDYNPGSKLFRKQRTVTKTIQATSSNHENSIQTKNVYLVVAGRKKEKIYEIKTAGSQKFQKEHIKDDAIENLSNFKHIIKSLNMEKKRKKDKNDSKIGKKNETQVNICETKKTAIEHVCKCSPAPEENVIDARSGKSRVRIFGRIGITEDDKYVLKCQATVDDEPVPRSLDTAEKQLSSSSLAAYSKNAKTTCQKIGGVACVRGESQDAREDIKSLKDSIMQTDFQNNAVNELLLNIDNKNRISKESQSTQVNFYKNGNAINKTSPFRTSEQVTRCNCSNTDYPVIKTVNNEYDAKNLKPCQSPLVIISVFPKQDNNLADVVQTVQCAQIENTRARFPVEASTSKTEIKKNKNKKPRSRSPSPKGAKTRQKTNKTVETRHVNTSSRNESPLRSKLGKKDSKKGTNSPTQTLQFFNSNTKKDDTKKKRKPSPPRNPRAISPTRFSPVVNKKDPHKKNPSRQSLRPKQLPKRKVDQGVNTEHLKTKKALVESYTNKITEQMNANKEEYPAKSVSTVSVNIDGENEQYDLTFSQNKFTTDFKVRKTMKEASVQKSYEEKERHGSMENFFPNMSKKHKRNSACRPSTCKNLSDDLINNLPTLTLRDSLEIGHRREDKAMKLTQTRRRHDSEQLTVNSDDMEFLAPIKHFTGDDCTICDPVERDREIRELLGVDERRINSQFKDPQSQVFGDQISRHCFYSKQCERTFVAGFALNKITCECNDETKNCNDANCDFNDEESDGMEQKPDPKNTGSKKPIIQTDHQETNTNAEQKHHQNINEECPCFGDTRKCNIMNCEKNRDSCPCIGESKKCNIPTCDKSSKAQENNHKAEPISPKNTNKDTEQNNDLDKNVNPSNQLEAPNLDRTSLYQQLTLNRNIQIFLQVEQFSKQKPIVLSKKQYNKIKKTIQHTIQGREKSKKCVCNRSIVSVGQNNGKPTQDVLVYTNREIQTDVTHREVDATKESRKHTKSKKRSKKEKDVVETVMLFSNENRGSLKNKQPDRVIVKRAASSMEIRNVSVAYWKHVTFSSTNVGSIGSSSFAKRNVNSIETIFRGHKKSVTPNLGTSAFSLLSEEARISESQSLKPCSADGKAKKPFLRRLMSCLVMRSAKASEKLPGQVSNPPSVNSSVDSYHISTSLGAIEMSSSIYDTSASFYSDHSIHPLSSKHKRSFFNSVRGFLTSRKS